MQSVLIPVFLSSISYLLIFIKSTYFLNIFLCFQKLIPPSSITPTTQYQIKLGVMTWALIAILIYAFVMHTRLVPGLRGRWTFNFLSIVAYASIMMTYFGVNFYLVGLHSYASGAQVITPSFIWYCVVGVILLGGISFWKHKKIFKK